MKEELKAFGLTENEARIYLALCELKEATATPLRSKTDLHMSRVYEALNSLIEKGLASYFLRNNVKHFKPSPPEVLLQILERRKEQIQGLVSQIKLLGKDELLPYSMSIYEGYKAFKQLYDSILDGLSQQDEILVLGAQESGVSFLGSTFFKHYTQRRIKLCVKARMIFNTNAKLTAKKHNNAYTAARVLPTNIVVPSTMDIFPDKVALLLLKEKPLVFLIECKEIADSYRTYFEYLWKSTRT